MGFLKDSRNWMKNFPVLTLFFTRLESFQRYAFAIIRYMYLAHFLSFKHNQMFISISGVYESVGQWAIAKLNGTNSGTGYRWNAGLESAVQDTKSRCGNSPLAPRLNDHYGLNCFKKLSYLYDLTLLYGMNGFYCLLTESLRY